MLLAYSWMIKTNIYMPLWAVCCITHLPRI